MFATRPRFPLYKGADKSLARPNSRCILFDGENISFDASLVTYINSTNIPPIMFINRMYEYQNQTLHNNHCATGVSGSSDTYVYKTCRRLVLQHFRKTEIMMLWCKAPQVGRYYCGAMTYFLRRQVTSVLRESWMQMVPPKRWYQFPKFHCIISDKAVILIFFFNLISERNILSNIWG
jgi:hypothetical protein